MFPWQEAGNIYAFITFKRVFHLVQPFPHDSRAVVLSQCAALDERNHLCVVINSSSFMREPDAGKWSATPCQTDPPR